MGKLKKQMESFEETFNPLYNAITAFSHAVKNTLEELYEDTDKDQVEKLTRLLQEMDAKKASLSFIPVKMESLYFERKKGDISKILENPNLSLFRFVSHPKQAYQFFKFKHE